MKRNVISIILGALLIAMGMAICYYISKELFNFALAIMSIFLICIGISLIYVPYDNDIDTKRKSRRPKR